MILTNFKSVLIGLAVLLGPALVQAQTPLEALKEAQTRLVCGTGVPVAAQYLPGGLLQVTCRQTLATNSLPTELQGTGLTSSATAGVIAAITVLAITIGDEETGTTTTTTEGGGS